MLPEKSWEKVIKANWGEGEGFWCEKSVYRPMSNKSTYTVFARSLHLFVHMDRSLDWWGWCDLDERLEAWKVASWRWGRWTPLRPSADILCGLPPTAKQP